MVSQVRVLNITHVLPIEDQAAVPSPPPPPLPDDGLVKLSFMDALFIDRVPMQRLFFFEGPDVPPFPSLVHSLQSSLAAVLGTFVPLSGMLTYRPSTGDVVVDCSKTSVSSGVKFVEAEYSGSIDDMRRLAVGDEHDTEALMRLGPELNAEHLPVPVLAVQVTRPAVGDGQAVAVAVAIHHAVADGLSVWRFMEAWSAVCRTGRWPDAAGLVPPTFDRTVIRYPRADEASRKILHTISPELPVARSPSLCIPPIQRRRSFVLSADDIKRVKQRILAQSKAMGEPLDTLPVSTFVAVSSLVWTSIVRAKFMSTDNPAADAYYLMPVDLRRRLVPPVDDRFFGNCVAPCFARAAVGDLRDDATGLVRAAKAVRAAVGAAVEGDDLLAGAGGGWIEAFAGIPKEMLTRTGSSNRFKAYEVDFGWGKPSRVEVAAVFVREPVLLLGAREEGAVQVTVALDHAHMEGFAANFLRVSGGEGDAARGKG